MSVCVYVCFLSSRQCVVSVKALLDQSVTHSLILSHASVCSFFFFFSSSIFFINMYIYSTNQMWCNQLFLYIAYNYVLLYIKSIYPTQLLTRTLKKTLNLTKESLSNNMRANISNQSHSSLEQHLVTHNSTLNVICSWCFVTPLWWFCKNTLLFKSLGRFNCGFERCLSCSSMLHGCKIVKYYLKFKNNFLKIYFKV